MGNIYACGNTYSPSYVIGGDQDIAVFNFLPSNMKYDRPNGWSIVWGGPLTETATGIAVDETSENVYISGYTNSEGTLSGFKYDMIVLKLKASTGILIWARRFGGNMNDRAYGLTTYGSSLYIVGESDSPGWTSVKTDMIIIKMDPLTQ